VKIIKKAPRTIINTDVRRIMTTFVNNRRTAGLFLSARNASCLTSIQAFPDQPSDTDMHTSNESQNNRKSILIAVDSRKSRNVAKQ